MTITKRILSVTDAPVMFGGFIYASLELVGGSYGYGYLLALLFAALLISSTAKRIAPYERDWHSGDNDNWRDTIRALVRETANSLFVMLLPIFVALTPDFGWWPHEWPLWAQLLQAICIADLGIMLVQYSSRKSPTPWRFRTARFSA